MIMNSCNCTSRKGSRNVSRERSRDRDYSSTSKRETSNISRERSADRNYPGLSKGAIRKLKKRKSRRENVRTSPPSPQKIQNTGNPSDQNPGGNTGNAGQRSRRRYRPGELAMKEVRKYQSSTELLVRKLPFSRLVREMTTELHGEFRWEARAILALQESAEQYLISVFQDAYLCTTHAGRVTLKLSDMQLARRIRGRYESFI